MDGHGMMDGIGMIRPDLASYEGATNLLLNEKIKALIREGRNVYHFAFGESPFPIIEAASDALKDTVKETSYLPVSGIPELRRAICQFHARYDGVQFDPDNVIVGPGSKELMFLVFLVFHGDILVNSPSWTTYKPQLHLSGHNPITLVSKEEEDWKITPSLIEDAMQHCTKTNKILILTNPDNPTGITYSAEEMKALTDVCRKHNIIVLSDEIYGRLHHDNKHVCFSKVYPEGTILSTGLSKWAAAGGWRVGYLLFPPELEVLKKVVTGAGSHTYSCCAAPMQYAITKMLAKEEAVDEYIKHTSRIIAAVGKYVHRELTEVGVSVVKPSGAYYMLPSFEPIREKLHARGIKTCEEMCKVILEEASVALIAAGPGFLRPDHEFTTRLGYVCFDGKKALDHSRQLGLETELGEDFVVTVCTNVHDGIQALKAWVVKQ